MARMKQRRRTAAQWTSENAVLLDGEIGLETDTRKVKYGDGVTTWNALAYPPTGSGAARYDHIQAVASATWVIPHNLGYLPIATALTVGNVEMIGEVVHISVNVLNILFDSAVAGRAILV